MEQPDLQCCRHFSVTLTGANGCDSVATLNLTIKPTSTSTTNIAICPNQCLIPGTAKLTMVQEPFQSHSQALMAVIPLQLST